jgi:hypothetical protein
LVSGAATLGSFSPPTTFGHALEKDTSEMVTHAGGKVVGGKSKLQHRSGDYSTRSTFRANQRLQSFPGSLRGFSFANFVRNKLSEQILKLAWQRRAEERLIVRVQLTADCS